MSMFTISRSRNAKENPNKVALKGNVKKTSLGCGAFFVFLEYMFCILNC